VGKVFVKFGLVFMSTFR